MNLKTEQFIEKARKIHGDKYDYSTSEYIHSMKNVYITCPIHGLFSLRPNNHISGKQGCSKCSNKHRPTTNDFIEKARKIHGDKYDYSLTKYEKNNHTKIIIICPKHGKFNISPKNHISGKCSGCPSCGNANKGAYHKKDKTKFIEDARKMHGDTYDYSLVEYKNTHTKIDITCNDHGIFKQDPASHIRGTGCPKCSHQDYQGGWDEHRFNNHPEIKNLPAILYLINIYNEHENFFKIGITQKTVEVRFTKNNKLPYDYTIINIMHGEFYDMFKIEQKIIKEHKIFKYIPNKKFAGYTECFVLEGVDMIMEYFLNDNRNY